MLDTHQHLHCEPTRLEKILALAASPWERATGEWLELVPNAELVAQRETLWIETVTNGDRALFEQLLARRQMDLATWRSGLQEVRVILHKPRPRWANGIEMLVKQFDNAEPSIPPLQVKELCGKADLPTGVDPDAIWLYNTAFAPWLNAAMASLREWSAECLIALSETAARQILVQLAQRWNTVSNRVFLNPVSIANILASCPRNKGDTVFEAYLGREAITIDHWFDLWLAYPVLARLIALVYLNWCRTIRTFLVRLTQDETIISDSFASGKPLGSLEQFNGDMGDGHEGGQSVAILTFSSGVKVVYKPKDLRIAQAYMNLLHELNRDSDLVLATRQIICRDGYAWEEFIAAKECTQIAQVKRFFQRLGMQTRLLQWLKATDFHHENLVADGEQPILIDLETLFTPHLPHPTDRCVLDCKILELLWDSPLMIGLISSKTQGEQGRRALELGALAPSGQQESPYRVPLYVKDTDNTGRIVSGYSSITIQPATPRLHGQYARIHEYVDDLIAGYTSMDVRLRQTGNRLILSKFLCQVTDYPVRYVHRPTQIYMRLLTASLSPICLSDAITREIVLERLWKGYLYQSIPTDLIQSEIDDLRALDIPFFTARPGSNAIWIGNRSIPSCFRSAVLEGVQTSLRELTQQSTVIDLDLLHTALFILDPEIPASTNKIIRKKTQPEDFLQAATEIGNLILHNAQSERKEIAWIGLNYQPQFDTWQLGRLSDDLFSGSAGIALVLADLAQRTGNQQYGEVAYAMVRQYQQRIDREYAQGDVKARWAFMGIGSVLYACQRVSQVLQIPDLLSWTIQTAAMLLKSVDWNDSPTDDFMERWGLILSLLNGNPETASLLPRLRNWVINQTEATHHLDWDNHLPFVQDAIPLQSLPTARGRVYLTQMRLAYLIGETELFHESQQWFQSECLKNNSDHPGAMLACLDAMRFSPERQNDTLCIVERYLATIKPSSRNYLEAAEVAITAYQITHQSQYLDYAQTYGYSLIQQYCQTSSWFSDILAADRFYLSAIVGIAAIAHLFLKLEHPTQVRSLRLLY